MHSSILRDDDFRLAVDGAATDLAQLFGHVTIKHRLGVVCPNPLDGLGAATLLLAAVTAFYNGYRRTGDDFFAYPDFFAFQLSSPAARYGRLDIWPDHKNVLIEPGDMVDAITDRGVNTLLLPQGWSGDSELQPEHQAALHRCLQDGWTYAPHGWVEAADVVVDCAQAPIAEWIDMVAATANLDTPPCYRETEGDRLQQSFRRITVDDTISRL